MKWNDILGFLIVLFIFLLPLLRKTFSDRHRKQEEHPRVEEMPEAEEAEEEFLPPLSPFAQPTPMAPRTEEKFEFHSRFEAKKKKHLKQALDPLSVALKTKTPLQALMLASQILGEPKSFKDEP